MDEFDSLSHSKWECKYHVVFIPKCRRRTLYGQLRQHFGVSRHQEHSATGLERSFSLPQRLRESQQVPPRDALP